MLKVVREEVKFRTWGIVFRTVFSVVLPFPVGGTPVVPRRQAIQACLDDMASMFRTTDDSEVVKSGFIKYVSPCRALVSTVLWHLGSYKSS